MACIKLTILALLFGLSANAQTFAEWFSQKKTQKKYLLQQIAALQIYGGYVRTGYSIAKNGLGSIGGYVGQEYNKHKGYYTYIKTASAAVKQNPQVNDIIRWQQDILNQTSAIKKQSGLTANESTYAKQVCTALLTDCDARMNELQTVLADTKVEMSDEERFLQTASIHAAMQDNYRFVRSFQNQLQVYVRSKQQDKQAMNSLNQLYAKR